MTQPPLGGTGGEGRPGGTGLVAPGGRAPADEPGLVDEAAAVLEEDRPPGAGTRQSVVTALVVLALGVAVLVGALGLGTGTPSDPGPGAWPLAVAVVLVALSVVALVAAPRTADAEAFTRRSWGVVAGVATLVVFVALIGVIGFEIPALLLCFTWLRFLGREGWRTSVVVSAVVVAAFYALFVVGLSVPIPHLF